MILFHVSPYILVKNKVSNSDNNSKEFSYYFLFKELMKKVSFTCQLLGQQEISLIFIFRKEISVD